MEKTDFNKTLGAWIKEVREQKGTQSDVATLMEMDAQNLSKYERGLISPTVFWIHKFCNATGTDFSEFMSEFGNRKM
jgi:transcriptional regulator with XRE-family HTH domain